MSSVQSLADVVLNGAEEAANEPAVVFPSSGTSLTYAGLADLSARYAGLLGDRHVGRGDRVVTILPNGPEAVGMLFAAAMSGAIVVPINWHHRGAVLEYMVRRAEPSLVVADSSVVDAAQMASVRTAGRCVTLEAAAWSEEACGAMPRPGRRPQRGDPVSIMYTSGTTGPSKGAVLPHGLYLQEAESFNEIVRPVPGDRYFTTLPLFHTNAQCLTLLGALMARLQAVIVASFSASGVMGEVRRSGATVMNVLGAMVPMMLKRSPDRGAQGRLRMVVGGGIPEPMVDELCDRFRVEFRRIYGLTETGLNAGEVRPAARGSIGVTLAHNRLRIAGGGDPAAQGEIQLKELDPDVFFKGYWQDDQATADAYTADGWFKTGDLGRMDDEGCVHFAGRLKESIRRRGENISCSEVEMVVNELPEIAECAAVAVSSELAEDEVKIAYVVREGASVSWQAVLAHCRDRMAKFMVPRYFEQVERIPRTATQKIERYRLSGVGGDVRDAAEPGPGGGAGLPQSERRPEGAVVTGRPREVDAFRTTDTREMRRRHE